MIGIVALLASATTPAPAAISPDSLSTIFASACLDGTVSLDQEQASEVAIDDVPSDIRHRLGKPISGKVWRLNSSGPSFLYVLDYKPTRVTYPRICGVASEVMPFTQALELVGNRVGGLSPDDLHKTNVNAEWFNAEDGYSASVSKIQGYTVVELKQLSPDQQKRALRELGWTGVPKKPRATVEPK